MALNITTAAIHALNNHPAGNIAHGKRNTAPTPVSNDAEAWIDFVTLRAAVRMITQSFAIRYNAFHESLRDRFACSLSIIGVDIR